MTAGQVEADPAVPWMLADPPLDPVLIKARFAALLCPSCMQPGPEEPATNYGLLVALNRQPRATHGQWLTLANASLRHHQTASKGRAQQAGTKLCWDELHFVLLHYFFFFFYFFVTLLFSFTSLILLWNLLTPFPLISFSYNCYSFFSSSLFHIFLFLFITHISPPLVFPHNHFSFYCSSTFLFLYFSIHPFLYYSTSLSKCIIALFFSDITVVIDGMFCLFCLRAFLCIVLLCSVSTCTRCDRGKASQSASWRGDTTNEWANSNQDLYTTGEPT